MELTARHWPVRTRLGPKRTAPRGPFVFYVALACTGTDRIAGWQVEQELGAVSAESEKAGAGPGVKAHQHQRRKVATRHVAAALKRSAYFTRQSLLASHTQRPIATKAQPPKMSEVVMAAVNAETP
jgi:hypothetical protein